MKTCTSVSVGLGSGLLASNYKASAFPSIDLQSWTFKSDRGDQMSFFQRERFNSVSVLFSCMPLAFCPVLFSSDESGKHCCLQGTDAFW